MSSSIAQLVLDFIVFAVIHYYIIFPLITRALGYIKGEPVNLYTRWDISKAFENLKAFIDEQSEQRLSNINPPAPFTAGLTTIDEILCERCELLIEDQSCVTRRSCDCTWCVDCVEECIRKMFPYVEHLLSEKSLWQVERAVLLQATVDGIDLGKHDWMLDVDELEEF